MCYLEPIHAEAWQKPTQYYKAIILQLKRNVFLKCSSVHAQAPAPPQSILRIQGSWSLALPPRPALQTRAPDSGLCLAAALPVLTLSGLRGKTRRAS